MEEIPFWEETYRNRDINTFPGRTERDGFGI